MQPQSAQLFEQLISKPRLQSYRGYFHARLEEAVGLYMWNCELTSSFGSLLALLEVVLRNNIHRAISQDVLKLDSGHWYDGGRVPLKFKTLQKIVEIRKNKPGASADEIVSRLTFGFWPAALKTIGAPGRVIPQIFPHHALSAVANGWSTLADRKLALSYLYEINDFRNRLAHHEPLWKFGPLMDPFNANTVLIGPSLHIQDSLARLQRVLAHIDAAFEAIDPSLAKDVQASSWRRRLDYLLSARGVTRYRSLRHVTQATVRTPAEFRRRFALLAKANQPVQVKNMNGGGLFIPD
jgi:Abi-like protein